jgi:dTDP-4-amino-4,6-dideoxygalactose transaminase
MVGTIGDCGMFSFHPRKLITTGEGGMLTTNREDIAETVRSLRSHGESLSGKSRRDTHQIFYPEYTMLGYNYRMTDLQGAVGVEQIKKLPALLKKRRQLAARYHQLLADPEQEEYLRLPGSSEGLTHSYQSYVLLLTPKVKKDRDQLSHELQERGIATRKGTYHVPGTKFYRETFGFQKGDFPCSEQAESRSLALPLYPGMQEDEMEYVVDNLCDLLRGQ